MPLLHSRNSNLSKRQKKKKDRRQGLTFSGNCRVVLDGKAVLLSTVTYVTRHPKEKKAKMFTLAVAICMERVLIMPSSRDV